MSDQEASRTRRFERPAILRIDFQTPIAIVDWAEAFRAIDRAYALAFIYLDRVERALGLARLDSLERFMHAVNESHLVPERKGPKPWIWHADSQFLPDKDRLCIVRIRAESPGMGDLKGASGPLETLRKYRVDRDERRKDAEWREELQRERMAIENDLKRSERDRVEALADSARTEAIRQRFELLVEVLGVDEARTVLAQELTSANMALDKADMAHAPRMLPPEGRTGPPAV
jgi:hypothetical protein